MALNIEKAFQHAVPGRLMLYHVGNLARDREFIRPLDYVASRLWGLWRDGLIELVQGREAGKSVYYFIKRRKRARHPRYLVADGTQL